jgi:hypothetical protein
MKQCFFLIFSAISKHGLLLVFLSFQSSLMFWTFKFSFEILTFIGSVAVLATIPQKLGDFSQ